jgi:DNA repair ATPase RecN
MGKIVQPQEHTMARAKNAGNGRLEEALATLIQNQAAFLARASETDAHLAELARRTDERFARIEERFFRIEALLMEYNRLLEALPETIREKIGFKMPTP